MGHLQHLQGVGAAIFGKCYTSRRCWRRPAEVRKPTITAPSGGEQSSRSRKQPHESAREKQGGTGFVVGRRAGAGDRHQRRTHPGGPHRDLRDRRSHLQMDDWARRTIPVPMVVGHEFVGEIVAVGSNVADFRPVMWLAARDTSSAAAAELPGGAPSPLRPHQGHRRESTRSVRRVHRPALHKRLGSRSGRGPRRASIFDPFGNAVHTALSFPVLGEDVLITGAGPIGIMAVAVVRHAGARHVVITDVNPYRLELAKKMEHRWRWMCARRQSRERRRTWA